jgi:class 3 adenylate cyclase
MSDQSARRLAAILAADVVGYSRLMGADASSSAVYWMHCGAQRDMGERNATVPPARRVEYRIGIHQGDIV